MARIAGVMKGLVKWKNVIIGKWHLKENREMVLIILCQYKSVTELKNVKNVFVMVMNQDAISILRKERKIKI